MLEKTICGHYTTGQTGSYGSTYVSTFQVALPYRNRPRLAELVSTDTFFASIAAYGEYTCAQLSLGVSSRYIEVYGMQRESQGPQTLEDFIRDVGAPHHIRSDNARMETGRMFSDICRKYNISQQTTEPHHPHQNPAERSIQTVKRMVQKIMDRTGAPDKLWYLCLEYVTLVLNRTAVEQLGWQTHYEKLWGSTPDISCLLQFFFYEQVYYLDTDASFPTSTELRGHFVGVATNTGDALTFRIWTSDGTLLARSLVHPTTTSSLRLATPGGDAPATTPLLEAAVDDTTAPANAPPRLISVKELCQAENYATFDPQVLIGAQVC